MNRTEHFPADGRGTAAAPAPAPAEISPSEMEASCRMPLLALFGGAALALVAGLALAVTASLTFHAPQLFADHPWLTYGRAQAAANDLLLYGFCIPAGLGVILWIFVRLSGAELYLWLAAFIGANLWHLGVLVGTLAVLIGDSTGFAWLEFPRGGSVLLWAAFWLIAVSAAATFGARQNRELYPSHWFLLAALFWFPWIDATANLFLITPHPVRGVAQAVIDWWFANNLVFVWLALVGLGAAFYFLPKLSGRPLHSHFLALFACWTLMLFGAGCGIPQGAPVPAWMPAASALAAVLLMVPLAAVAVITWKTVRGSTAICKGGPLSYIKLGTALFLLSGLMLVAEACPQISRVVEFTWFGPAQTQLQILGFFVIVMCGAIYELLPRVTGVEWPFPKFIRLQYWLFLCGVALTVLPLAAGGVEQGWKLRNAATPFADSVAAALPFLRAETVGLLLVLIGALLFAANIFAMTLRWKLALLKSALAGVKTPLQTAEVES